MKLKIIFGLVVLALGFLATNRGIFKSPAVPEKLTVASTNGEVPSKELSMGIPSSSSSSEDNELTQIVDETVTELLGPPPPAEMAELEEQEQLPLAQF